VASGSFHFEDFDLDPAERRLRRNGEAIELNGRYFDALELLVRDAGRLVSKDRFMDEVWSGIPVTDEALTQCIRTIRKQLGDEAGRPRFIETVPKHGYRFIAPVRGTGPERRKDVVAPRSALWTLGAAGTFGGALAGLLGGLFYGFMSSGTGIGSASAVLVLVCVTTLVGILGAAGVSFAIAAAGITRPWAIAGGALGGLVVGAIVKLVGSDAFVLLLGQSPGDVTGAGEGAVLGGAVGLGAWLASRRNGVESPERGVAVAALAAGIAGGSLPLVGGRLMGGSLDLLSRTFASSRLDLQQVGAMLGERGFGPLTQCVSGALEGALFGGCVVAAMLAAQRRERATVTPRLR